MRYLICYANQPLYTSIIIICLIWMTKKDDIQMQHALLLISAKQIFKICLLCYLPGPFCVAHLHRKPDQHNKNLRSFADSLDKVMPKIVNLKVIE